MKKAFVLCIIIVVTNVVQGQPLLGQELPMLYKLDRPEGKYVLCRNYKSPENRNVSEVIIADTFSIDSRLGWCRVTMSNACVLETKVNNAPAQHGTNTVVQNKMLFKAYGVAFPKGTKLIFNGSIIELWKAKLDGPEEGKLIYEGDEALRQLKKLGLEPPEDFDDKARQKP